MLAGDALVTAHYRLGIGINKGLTATDELADMVNSLALHDRISHARAKQVSFFVWKKQTNKNKQTKTNK